MTPRSYPSWRHGVLASWRAAWFFTFREPGRDTETWLHLRLADTRTGEIVGAAMIPLNSVGPTPRARADAGIRALLATSLPTPP